MPLLMQRLLAQRTCQQISHDWSTYQILQVHSGSCYLAGSRHSMLPLMSHVLQGHLPLKFWISCHSAVVRKSVAFIFLRFSLPRCCNNSMFPSLSVTEKRTSAGQTYATSAKNGLHAKIGFHQEKHWIRNGKSKAVLRIFRQSMCLWDVLLEKGFFGMYLIGWGVQ